MGRLLILLLDKVGFLCRAAARNKQYLSLLGVTHVLNTAEGVGSSSHGTVNLDKVETGKLDFNYFKQNNSSGLLQTGRNRI